MARQVDDYYSVLGIGRDATASDIDRAYRRAARATHPDINPDDSSAGQRFNAVTIAYQTLSNPERRGSYDRAQIDTVPAAGIRIVVHRHHPQRSATPVEGNLFEVVAALAQLINRWPFP